MTVWERRLWWLLWPSLTALAVVGEIVQARVHANHSAVIEFLGGYSFVVAGLIAWGRRPQNRLGRLMTLAAVFWFVGPYADAHVSVVSSIGMAFRGITPIAIAHLALSYPEGRVTTRIERALVAAGYAIVGAASLVVFLTFNPRRDVRCPCPAAPFGVFSNPPLLRFAYDSKDKVAGAVVLLAVILLVRRLLRANVTQRWLLSPLWVVAAVAGTTFVVRTGANFVSLSDPALAHVDDSLNLLSMLVPAVFLAGLLRTRLERSPLGDLVVALGSEPSGETLQRGLARILRDPTVELAYWLPSRDGYVDAAGREFVLPPPGGSRCVTVIERDGERLAAIVHDPALLENPRLVDVTTAAAGLALDNERLQAELRAQIEEVQASRIRIIDAGDNARRRIERDLHDGAQQRLLATALSLRMATDALPDNADDATRRALGDAADETLVALAELRDLAHGIHPAILTEQGLGPAIESLAERAAAAVTVDVPSDRFASSVEATVYFVVSEAFANVAKHAGANTVTVNGRRDGDDLVVEVTDDGCGGAAADGGSGLRGLNDRAAALGGRLEVDSPVGEGTLLRIVVPCS